MTNEISIAVTGMTAVQTDGPGAVVSDNTGYRVRFRFDEIWRQCGTVTALFLREDGACYPPVMLTLSAEGEAVCGMPAVNGTSFIRIGAASGSTGNGEEEPELYTTSAAEIPVVSSVRELSGQILDTPPADVWSTVTELVGQCGEKLKEMTGAAADTAGKSGMVPAPAAGDEEKVLFGNGTWGNLPETGALSGAGWRRIRSIEIPYDATVDGNGVTWYIKEDEPLYIYGFTIDTDENGQPFNVSEIAMFANGTCGGGIETGPGSIGIKSGGKSLFVVNDAMAEEKLYGFYWIRKIGKLWSAEVTIGASNNYRKDALEVRRTGFAGVSSSLEQLLPGTLSDFEVQGSIMFDAGYKIDIWGR